MKRVLIVFLLCSIGLNISADMLVPQLVGTKYAEVMDGYRSEGGRAFVLTPSGEKLSSEKLSTMVSFSIFENLKSKQRLWIVSKKNHEERRNGRLVWLITYAMKQPGMAQKEGVAIGECSKNNKKMEYVVAIVKYDRDQFTSSDVRSAWIVGENEGDLKPYPTKGLECSVSDLISSDGSYAPRDVDE